MKFLNIVLILFISIFFSALMSCENSCKHNWIDATCNSPKVCSKCKTTEGNSLEHDFIEGKCIMCDKVQYHTHEFNIWNYNELMHWNVCQCGEKNGTAAHTWDEGTEISGNGIFGMEYTCIFCKKKEQVLVTLVPPTSNVNEPLKFVKKEKQKELLKYKDMILTNIDISLNDDVNDVFNRCIIDLSNAQTISEVSKIYDKCLLDVYEIIPSANGEFDFSGLDDSERKRILTLLEEYIFRNHLEGIAISPSDRLNLNSTTKQRWEEFFGVNGSKWQTDESSYWNVNPLLSNEYFLKGLNLCINKELIDFEYKPNSRYEHLDYSKNEYYSYDFELARKYFNLALLELVEDGVYDITSIEEPIKLSIELAFGGIGSSKYDEIASNIFSVFKSCVEVAFNDESVTGGNFKLTVVEWRGEIFGDIHYLKQYCGQYDVAYCPISGGTIDSHKYLYYELLSSSSEISSGFTVSWCIDTNDIEDDCIIYNGYKFTYDALLSLLNGKCRIVNGEIVFTSVE